MAFGSLSLCAWNFTIFLLTTGCGHGLRLPCTRGYMDDIENKNIYFNQVKYPDGYGKVRFDVQQQFQTGAPRCSFALTEDLSVLHVFFSRSWKLEPGPSTQHGSTPRAGSKEQAFPDGLASTARSGTLSGTEGPTHCKDLRLQRLPAKRVGATSATAITPFFIGRKWR